MEKRAFLRDSCMALGFLGPVTARHMFGGAGFYLDGLIFAISDFEHLYFKVDDVSRATFEEAGGERFTFEGGTMNYYRVPGARLDSGNLEPWAQLALEAAARKKR